MKRFMKIAALSTAVIMAMSVLTATSFAINLSESNNMEAVDELRLVTRTKSSTVSSTSLALNPGERGESIPVSFSISGIPSGASISKIEVKVGSYSSAGGGVIAVDGVHLTAPDGIVYNGIWSAGPQWTINNIQHIDSNGTWSFYFEGVNISSYNAALLQYNNVKLTITYTT